MTINDLIKKKPYLFWPTGKMGENGGIGESGDASHFSHSHFSHLTGQNPKDNPVNETFNGTLQREFLNLGNLTPDVIKFNQALTEWLIEYNFNRPHQTLGYQTPGEFHFQHHKVLPMYPSSTQN